MTPSMIMLSAIVVLFVVIIAIINKNSIRRDRENADFFHAQLQDKDQALADLKASVDDANRVIAKLEKNTSALTDVISSLNADNQKLRAELDEQKKRLDFYLGIDRDAEEMTVDEDAKEREALLEKVRQQVADQQNYTQSAGENAPTPESTHPLVSVFSTAVTLGTNEKKASDGEAGVTRILDEEQEFARNYMESTSENLFITGKAGTGKSFLLDAFRTTTAKGNIVLAPTGIAALNVDGATLHSTFGYSNLVNLDVDSISEATIKLKSEKKTVLRRVSTIIIDEISMVRADTFDKIDRILRVINHSDKPFGGKQMLLFGDLFQLPPVAKSKEMDYLYDRYGGIHFFHSDAYKSGHFKFIELTQNHRQKGDRAFFEVLNRIREGHSTDEDITLLNTRYTTDESQYDRFVTLFPTKAEAEKVNSDHLQKLETREYVYLAKTVLDKRTNKNKSFDSIFPVLSELRLKKGASVMMVANDPEHKWVNGSMGIVKELTEDGIQVSFGENRVYDILPFEFDEQEITYVNGKIAYEKIYSIMQYPVVPAYAITIHKSQGQTYSKVACDIDRCFASGQAYVALSRCASLEGLHLKSLITPASIKVDREVLDFYREQVAKDILKQA